MKAEVHGPDREKAPPPARVGDIVAIRGTGFLSRAILKATGNTVSHVGMIIAASPGPTLVIEALWRVKTRPLVLSLDGAEKAYLLSDHSLEEKQRNELVFNACKFSAEDYGWWALVLQGADAIFHTTFFTDRFAWGMDRHPICSYLVAKAYQSLGLTFGREKSRSITPADIYRFASTHPLVYSVTLIHEQDRQSDPAG